MSLDTLALMALILAAVPCGLFLANLFVYRPLPRRAHPTPTGVSVLIPARDEEQNIHASVQAALANRDLEIEVIVLDDHSSDHTAEIVSQMARMDPRLRLETAPPLPAGWCGKQHACHVLSRRARHPLMVFIDADVHLASDAVGRMAAFMEQTGLDLASGVPRQTTVVFSERLLIPLIHFVLLGFLPMHAMRRYRLPALSAGCGQLFIVRRAAYRVCGGHAMIPGSLHDGVKLPRVFRRAGFATGLFDATDLAVCRMYRSDLEVWRGLGKNATEGLGAPGAILPMTVLLLGGQVLPFVLLMGWRGLSAAGLAFALAAAGLVMAPRLAAVRLFRQPLGAALLHPIGVAALLGLQWFSLARSLTGRRPVWKGRDCGSGPVGSHSQAL